MPREPIAAPDLPGLLILTSTYPRWSGDPEPGFVHELAKRLTDRFRVTVLGPHAPGAREREVLDGVDVVRYRYAPESLETLVNDGGVVSNIRCARWKIFLVPTFVLSQLWTAWRHVRKHRCAVIHAHWLIPQGLVAALLQWLPGRKVPFLVTSHGVDLYALKGPLPSKLKQFVARRAYAATVVSEAMVGPVEELGITPSNIRVLSMGVDLVHRFYPDPDVKRTRGLILFVGRLVEKKGAKHLLNAMPHVLRQVPDARLVIAGFGPERPALEAQAASLGVERHVEFLGAVSQDRLPPLYRQASLLVAPFVRATSGDEEGLGLVLVEAIGCGCPVLAGKVPALADVLGPDNPRMTIDPVHEEGVADRIVEILGRQSEALANASRLRERIVRRFDWGSVANAYAELLATRVRPAESRAG